MSNSSKIPTSILFVSSIFLLFATSHSASLIEVACANATHCTKLLESHPKVVSAKTYKDLALRILESGSRNATKTQTYLDNLAKNSTKPNSKASLEGCRDVYSRIISVYALAHDEVHDDVMDGTADYDLVIAYTGTLQRCIQALDSAKITDATLSSSNYVMPVYAMSALEAVHQLRLE